MAAMRRTPGHGTRPQDLGREIASNCTSPIPAMLRELRAATWLIVVCDSSDAFPVVSKCSLDKSDKHYTVLCDAKSTGFRAISYC